MRPIDDSSFLTPDERLSELASILAAGILRLAGGGDDARKHMSECGGGPRHLVSTPENPASQGRPSDVVRSLLSSHT